MNDVSYDTHECASSWAKVLVVSKNLLYLTMPKPLLWQMDFGFAMPKSVLSGDFIA